MNKCEHCHCEFIPRVKNRTCRFCFDCYKKRVWVRKPLYTLKARRSIEVNGSQRELHRYIMEKIIGRKLKTEELVHHIDGNKHNNSPSNLKIVSREEHVKIHANYKKPKYSFDIKQLIEDHWKMTFNQMADKYNCSASPIQDVFNKYKLHDRYRCVDCGLLLRSFKLFKERRCCQCYDKKYGNRYFRKKSIHLEELQFEKIEL